jgi:deoxyribonuclease-4
MSIAGGVSKAIQRGAELSCEAIQIFVKNNVQWNAPPLEEEEVVAFSRAWKQSGVHMIFAHACYLINLASPDRVIYQKSLECLSEEYERCVRLDLPFIVLHPGSHRGTGLEEGVKRVAGAVDTIFRKYPRRKVKILLETTSGQGDTIGGTPEELSCIISTSRYPHRLGVCLDTCHIFAAGYDITSAAAYRATMKTFDSVVGLSKIHAIHLNDSKTPLGSHRDRHEHIGKGHLGLESFRNLLNDSFFSDLPMVLETPKEGGTRADIKNLRVLRSLF